MKLGFVVMTEYFKHQQVYTMFKMMEAAKAKNHEVIGIFFFGTGALNIKKKIEIGKVARNIPQALEDLSDVPKYACQTWADNYGVGVENDEIIQGTEIAGLGELSEITAKADKLIVFGARA